MLTIYSASLCRLRFNGLCLLGLPLLFGGTSPAQKPNWTAARFDYPPGPVLVLNNAASGSADGFVAKFDPAGTTLWATQASGTGSEQLPL